MLPFCGRILCFHLCCHFAFENSLFILLWQIVFLFHFGILSHGFYFAVESCVHSFGVE